MVRWLIDREVEFRRLDFHLKKRHAYIAGWNHIRFWALVFSFSCWLINKSILLISLCSERGPNSMLPCSSRDHHDARDGQKNDPPHHQHHQEREEEEGPRCEENCPRGQAGTGRKIDPRFLAWTNSWRARRQQPCWHQLEHPVQYDEVNWKKLRIWFNSLVAHEYWIDSIFHWIICWNFHWNIEIFIWICCIFQVRSCRGILGVSLDLSGQAFEEEERDPQWRWTRLCHQRSRRQTYWGRTQRQECSQSPRELKFYFPDTSKHWTFIDLENSWVKHLTKLSISISIELSGF